MAAQAAILEIREISKRYGEILVLRGVDLSVTPGEFFTLLGPSGCGKTTLLRTIAGFVRPDAGSVFIDGLEITHVSPWKRDVGLVFQNYALWPHMTVFENIAFGLRERKTPRPDIEKRVQEALELVDLKGTENRRPSELSGGQQQRVALARTLVIQPRVLLLDEPLSNLDAKLRAEMRIELLKLQRDLGLTTIYVTHDQEEALALSTRIAVMNSGQIVQEGKPREVYEQPRERFVAEFVGKSNLFLGTVIHEEEKLMKIRTEEGFLVHAEPPDNLALLGPGKKVLVNIRPEAIKLIEASEESVNANRIAGRVVATAFQGSYIEYEIQAGGKPIKANVMNPKGKPLFQRGDEVEMVFAPEDVGVVRDS
jgi:spermidine/putrescine ABC transporter ATP-binding subunit